MFMSFGATVSRDCGNARALDLDARMSRHFSKFLMNIVHQLAIQLLCKWTVLTEHSTNDCRQFMTFNQRVRMQPLRKQGRQNVRTQLRKYRAIKYAYVCLSHHLCSGLNIPHRILLLIRVLFFELWLPCTSLRRSLNRFMSCKYEFQQGDGCSIISVTPL